MNKAALESVRQIIDDGLIRFGYISFNLVDFQRPDRVCGSVGHIDKGRKFFFIQSKRPGIYCLMFLR